MAAIYLIAAYARRAQMQQYAQQLEALGHTIASTWVIADPLALDDGTQRFPTELGRQIALTNAADLHQANTVIAFTEPPGSPHTRGTRHWVWGLACEAGHDLFLVGPEEHPGYALASLKFDTWEECREWFSVTHDEED